MADQQPSTGTVRIVTLDTGTASRLVPELRAVIGAAFEHDPLLVWLFPDGPTRLHAASAFMGLLAEWYARDAIVDVIEGSAPGSVDAVALWRLPTHELRSARDQRPSAPGLLAAIRGSDTAAGLLGALAVLSDVKPVEPHAYLHVLAVHPLRQGRGLGRALVAHGLHRARSHGLGAALETMNPENLPFYRSLGFAVTREFRFDLGGPPSWALWHHGGAAP